MLRAKLRKMFDDRHDVARRRIESGEFPDGDGRHA
jgi:hypothetical protein